MKVSLVCFSLNKLWRYISPSSRNQDSKKGHNNISLLKTQERQGKKLSETLKFVSSKLLDNTILSKVQPIFLVPYWLLSLWYIQIFFFLSIFSHTHGILPKPSIFLMLKKSKGRGSHHHRTLSICAIYRYIVIGCKAWAAIYL